jgi:tetratricopeptide (TPR) repeat protein
MSTRRVRLVVMGLLSVAVVLGATAGAVVLSGLVRWGTPGWYYHSDAEYRLRYGQRCLRNGDNDHAKEIGLLLEADGHRDQAALLRGEGLFLEAKSHADADKLDLAGPLLGAALIEFNKIRDKGALRREAAVTMGKCYLYMKNLHEAEKAFNFVLGEDKTVVDAHRGLASIYFDQGAMSRATFHLQNWAELDPQDGRPYRLMAFIDKEQENYADAIKHYREALSRTLPQGVPNQHRARLRKELAECLVKSMDYKAALELLDGFSPLPNDASAVEVLRAECLIGLGKMQEARTALENALEIYKDNNHLYRLRAKLYSQAGEYEKALADLSRALLIDRQDSESRYQLVLALEQSGRTAEAAEHKRTLEEFKKDTSERQDLEHAALERPWDAAPRWRLAELWQKAGRPDLAQKCREAAAQCPPPDAAAARKGKK